MLSNSRHAFIISLVLVGIATLIAYAITRNPHVLGAKSNNLYEMRLNDGVTKSAPGEILTYSVKVTNIYSENTILTPQLSITAKDLEIPAVQDNGRRGKLANGKPGGTVDWNYLTNPNQKIKNEVKVDTKKSHTFTFQVKTPSTLGSEYCIKAYLLPFLQDEDCNTVVKSTGKKSSTVATPTYEPPPKITENDFRIVSPDSLNTDRADQEITWYATDKLKAAYPHIKIELCPGKDFKDCIILDAVVENDGRHIINMPPIPRVGKWYLRLISRDTNGNLRPSISAAKRIELHK